MNVILAVKRFNSCSEILVSIQDLWNNLIVADLFNPFSLEYLYALEHFSVVMDVIYVSQLSYAWGFVATRLLNFPKFDESLSHFLYGQILRRRKFQTKEL